MGRVFLPVLRITQYVALPLGSVRERPSESSSPSTVMARLERATPRAPEGESQANLNQARTGVPSLAREAAQRALEVRPKPCDFSSL